MQLIQWSTQSADKPVGMWSSEAVDYDYRHLSCKHRVEKTGLRLSRSSCVETWVIVDFVSKYCEISNFQMIKVTSHMMVKNNSLVLSWTIILFLDINTAAKRC